MARPDATTRGGLGSPLAGRLARVALRKGIRDSSRAWLYVGAAAKGYQLIRFLLRPQVEVFRMRIRPGERIEVVHRARDSR
jgi:hypothetical protein